MEHGRAALHASDRRGVPHGAGGGALEAVLPPSLSGIFHEQSPYVAAIALRLLGRDDEVDDVVQDVFLRAIKGLSQIREPAALRGWLATVTVRVSRERLRIRRLKSFLRFDEAPSYEDVAAPGATPEERALLAQVYAVLDTLPVHDRIAWTLRYIEGEQLEDVATLSGCSLATAKRRIASAHSAIERRMVDA